MRGWCRVRPATEGSNFRKWQEYAVENLAGIAKSTEDRISLEKFLDALYNLDQSKRSDLCKTDGNFNRFMYSRGQFASIDSRDAVDVDKVLWDTGNGGSSMLAEKVYSANKQFFEPMEEEENSSIYLADAVTRIDITKKVRGALTVIGPGDKAVTINTTFCIIPMQCSIILGFKDMMFQAPDMLVSMIQEASAQASKQSAAEASASMYQFPTPSSASATRHKGVFMAQQLARGESRRVPHPKPRATIPE